MQVGLVVMDEDPAGALKIVRVAERAGGRFVLSVGSSTRRMNQDWYGTALQHPAPQVRERIHANELSLVEVASGWTA
jgi:hypothetical protein